MSLSPKSIDPYVQVGRSGLVVFKVGLGTMQFGWTADEQTSFELLDSYASVGGNFIDTADCYTAWSHSMGGPQNPGGVSEEIVGRWMAKRNNRDDMVVATKVRAAMGVGFVDNRATAHQREGLSRRWIHRACEDSLRRLGVDHIDLYQAHFIDPIVPIEETLSAFTDLVRRGLVRYIGVSNFSAWRLMQALWAADQGSFESIVSLQPQYNLLSRTRANFERELGPLCAHYGIGVLPYSPLAGGLLTGAYRKGQQTPDSLRAEENLSRVNDQDYETIEVVVDIAETLGVQPNQVALAWLSAQSVVSSPIVGASRIEQLEPLLNSDLILDSEHMRRLDEISDWVRSRTDLEE